MRGSAEKALTAIKIKTTKGIKTRDAFTLLKAFNNLIIIILLRIRLTDYGVDCTYGAGGTHSRHLWCRWNDCCRTEIDPMVSGLKILAGHPHDVLFSHFLYLIGIGKGVGIVPGDDLIVA